MIGGRKPSQWNLFVKKIYHDGKAKNSNYAFKQALVDASRRKAEMGHMKSASSSASSSKSKKARRPNKSRRSRSMALSGGKSRRRRRH